MPKYARYQPHPERSDPLDFQVRRAAPDDAYAIAVIDSHRNGGEPADIVDMVRRALERGKDAVWVAQVGSKVVGFAKLSWVDPGAIEGSRNVDAGYYLRGVIVEDGSRRRGIGRELTRVRLEWIAEQGATEAFYVARATNLPSIELHAKLGFVEVSRDFACPGMMSPGGEYALFRAHL